MLNIFIFICVIGVIVLYSTIIAIGLSKTNIYVDYLYLYNYSYKKAILKVSLRPFDKISDGYIKCKARTFFITV